MISGAGAEPPIRTASTLNKWNEAGVESFNHAIAFTCSGRGSEEIQIARLRSLAEDAGLDPVFTEKFLRFIVAEVIHHHQRIAEGEQL